MERQRYDGIHWYGDVECPDGQKRGGQVEVIGLQICAPQKDMNLDGMRVDGHQILAPRLDPVILQPVEQGFIIVTAWGDEAEDPLVKP
jgi:hypothetical protein